MRHRLFQLKRLAWMLFVLLPASLLGQSVSHAKLVKGPSVVRDMGYCPDVGSSGCEVREFWPRQAGRPDGVEAYYFINENNEVCFTTRKNYIVASIGSSRGTDGCIWRHKQWGEADVSGSPANWRAE